MQSDEKPVSDAVARARSLASVGEASELYRRWAATYDDDVFGAMGFIGSARIADLLGEVMADRQQPVVDLGCGTGAVGRRLAELGFSTVDGIDLSPEMLTIAAGTDAYRSLVVGDLTAFEHDGATYAASISAGTFTSGHVGPAAVPGLLAMVRPGGYVAWVVGATMWPTFEPVLMTTALNVRHRQLEPIRRGGPPEAVMFVAEVVIPSSR